MRVSICAACSGFSITSDSVSSSFSVPRATGDALASLGHEVTWWPELEEAAGAVCAVRVNPATGVLEGGADPRRLAYALGW